MQNLLILTYVQFAPDVFLTGLESCGAMSSKQTSNVRIFFDHLYFSVCCVLVGFLLVYCIARWLGYGFDLDDNIAVCVVTGAALSLILTAYLTYMSISRLRASSSFGLKEKDNANRFHDPEPRILRNAPTRKLRPAWNRAPFRSAPSGVNLVSFRGKTS